MGLELDPKEVHQCPALLSFTSETGMTQGGIIANHRKLEILFYQGGGRSMKIDINDPPPQLGMPLLKAMLFTEESLKENLLDPMLITHTCPGVLDKGVKCKGEAFEVTIDKRLDGIFILRLDCVKCGSTMLHDMRLIDKDKEEGEQKTILTEL